MGLIPEKLAGCAILNASKRFRDWASRKKSQVDDLGFFVASRSDDAWKDLVMTGSFQALSRDGLQGFHRLLHFDSSCSES